jgi:hypothetical protein
VCGVRGFSQKANRVGDVFQSVSASHQIGIFLYFRDVLILGHPSTGGCSLASTTYSDLASSRGMELPRVSADINDAVLGQRISMLEKKVQQTFSSAGDIAAVQVDAVCGSGIPGLRPLWDFQVLRTAIAGMQS